MSEYLDNSFYDEKSSHQYPHKKYPHTGHTMRNYASRPFGQYPNPHLAQEIVIDKKGEGLDRFVDHYIPEHGEMKGWGENVPYSIHKNKRWEFGDKIDTVFNKNNNDLASENFGISVAVKHADFKTDKSLYNNKSEEPIKHAKSKVNGCLNNIEDEGDTAVHMFTRNGFNGFPGTKQFQDRNHRKPQSKYTKCKPAKWEKSLLNATGHDE